MTYGIGVSLDEIFSYDSLGLPVPTEAFPVDYESYKDLGDGMPFGQGGLLQEQRFQMLTYAEYQKFKSFCPEKAAAVFVRTRKDYNTWAVYSAVMQMTSAPADDRVDILKDYVIKFTRMVEVV